jgi:hypothetical protein
VTAIPEALINYLADRDAQRTRNVEATLAALTERERRLIREAAVMGYVQGRRHPDDEDHPKDAAVLALVVDACLAHPDLYPVTSGILPCAECRHPAYNHRNADDPADSGTCLQCDAEGSLSDAHHDYRQTPNEEPQR